MQGMWSHDTHMIVIELYNVWMLHKGERGGGGRGGGGGGREERERQK